jgi:uncharacterized protein (DUF362 family)
MEKVFIYQQNEYDMDGIREVAKEIISGSGVDPKGKSVLLKPSFVYPSYHPDTVGVVTQPPFIGGVVRAFSELGASRILVGEDSVVGPSRSAFFGMRIYPYIRGLATPVYFDEERHVRVDVPDPLVQGSFTVPAVWPEADLFISLPKIKTNLFAKVSLSVKNNLGFQRQVERCHNHNDGTLQEKIADLYRVRPPDLVLADGIVGGEGQGPMVARPVELGVMVGGANGIAVDATCCRLMGIDPYEVEYLRYLEEAGIGWLGEGDIEISGLELAEAARHFDLPSNSLDGASANLSVFQGPETSCGYGCRGMVRCALDAWLEKGKGAVREMNVVLGKPVEGLPEDLDPRRTLVVGDCAAEHRDRGTYLPGCPPLPLDVAFGVQKFQGLVPTPVRIRDILKGYLAGYGWKAARFFRGHVDTLRTGE